MNRRQFLHSASAMAFLAAHEQFVRKVSSVSRLAIPNNGVARILKLRLVTAAPLAEMKKFYHELLGLPLLEDKAEEFTFSGGQTPITFAQAQPEHGEPFYHFAFDFLLGSRGQSRRVHCAA